MIVAFVYFAMAVAASIGIPQKMVSYFNFGRPDGKQIAKPNWRFLLDGWQIAVLVIGSMMAGLSAPDGNEPVDFPTVVLLVCLLLAPIFLSFWKTYKHCQI